MDPFEGKLEIPILDDEGSLQAQLRLVATLGVDGLPMCREVAIVAVEGREVTRDLIPLVAKDFNEFLDVLGSHLYAELASRRVTEGVVTIGSGEYEQTWEIGPSGPVLGVTLRPGEAFREAKFQELRKRRRSHRSDEDYQQVAEIYRRAQAEEAPVQESVAKALHVSTAHAARLIGEARKRGFLPPTTKGKAKA